MMNDFLRRKGGRISDGVGKVEKKRESAAELFSELEISNQKIETRNEGLEIRKEKREKRLPRRLAGIIILGVVLVVVLVLVISRIFTNAGINNTNVIAVDGKGENSKAKVESERSGWQAVFLVNGQTYFGKVEGVSEGFLILTDVYYLAKGGEGDKGGESREGEEGAGAKLVKFGTELHKPLDGLKINMGQVLMIEELAVDSEIIKAIQEYKDNIDDND